MAKQTIEDSVDFSIQNEADTLVEQGFRGEVWIEAEKRFLDGIWRFYAEENGYTVEQFAEEIRKRGLYTK